MTDLSFEWCSPNAFVISENQQESLSFIAQVADTMVLGHPCLRVHNAHKYWTLGRITGWSLFCLVACFCSAIPTVQSPAACPLPPKLPNLL